MTSISKHLGDTQGRKSNVGDEMEGESFAEGIKQRKFLQRAMLPRFFSEKKTRVSHTLTLRKLSSQTFHLSSTKIFIILAGSNFSISHSFPPFLNEDVCQHFCVNTEWNTYPSINMQLCLKRLLWPTCWNSSRLSFTPGPKPKHLFADSSLKRLTMTPLDLLTQTDYTWSQWLLKRGFIRLFTWRKTSPPSWRQPF